MMPSSVDRGEEYLSGYLRPAIVAGYFGDESWAKIYMDYAQPLEDMLVQCTFGNTTCTVRDFQGIFTDHGYCYSFNNDVQNPHSVTHAGEDFGLKMILNAQVDDYLPTTKLSGFIVMLHDQRDPAISIHYQAAVATYSAFALERVVINHLPEPYENCGEIALRNFDYYSYQACQLECESAYLVNECGCQSLPMNNTDAPTCSPIQEKDCAQDARFKYLADGARCANQCPSDCQQVFYKHALTLSTFSPQFYLRLAHKYGQNTSYWHENAVEILVHYNHLLEFTVIPHPTYTVGSLLCDLGGALGLILGASIITVLELIDFIIMWLLYKRK